MLNLRLNYQGQVSKVDEKESTILSGIAEVTSGVPAPIQKSFFKAVSDLLGGLVSLPLAKLKQYTQSIEDTTVARSQAASVISNLAIEEMSRDADLMKLAAEIYLPTNLRKVRNRVHVAQSAATHLSTSNVDNRETESAPPDEDWMNNFMRFAEDASSARVQDLFGRILAGEVTRPGSFGLSTLRTLNELDQSIAEDFMYAWAKGLGTSVDYTSEWRRGEDFMRWRRLAEAGLMASSSSSQFPPPFHPMQILGGMSIWSPISVNGVGLMVFMRREDSNTGWEQIDFTRVGREIGSILPVPDYETNVKSVEPSLRFDFVSEIKFFREGEPMETLWKASS